MAVKLDEMPKKRGRYPWDEWTDGSVVKVTQGEDFQTAVESFRTQLYGKARSLGKKVELVIEDKSITFRMYPKPETE